jgi:hypothetical protein
MDVVQSQKWPLKFRAVFEFLVIAVCICAFAFTAMGIFASMFGSGAAGTRDYVEYWAASHQILDHADPYDAVAILRVEHSAGYPAGLPAQLMPNPPWALLLVLPLGLMSPAAAEWFWFLLMLVGFILSVQILRTMLAPAAGLLHLIAYAFAPALSCLLAGQVGIFLLLGLVLFLRWHQSHPMLAGGALWFCLLKPHLFLAFGLVLLIWIVLTRNYLIVAGGAIALIVSSALATLLDPGVWGQYRHMVATAHADRTPLPCLGVYLRQNVYPHTFWIQCLPAALGCAWAVAFYWKRRKSWNWVERASILMLVSILVAPYIWFMDQTVLLPALLAGGYATRSRTLIAILALMSAGLEIAALRAVALYSPLYLWSAPAWLVWFLIATRKSPDLPIQVDAGKSDLLADR